jgi:hydroxymethylglutaryl-CoA synthase
MPLNTLPPPLSSLHPRSGGQALATIEAAYSYGQRHTGLLAARRQTYPSHGQRFTGEPAYFKHITEAGTRLMKELGVTAADFQYAIFHQPNTKFPQRVAGMLGFTPEQIKPGLLSPVIGNTYAGAALIGLTATLDIAQPVTVS